MNRYEEIDHPADWAFRAYGRDLKDLYENAAYALFALEGALDAQPSLTRSVTAQGDDRETLMINWLSALLSLQATKHETYQKFTITALTDTQLDATIQGARAVSMTRLIRAVSYDDLKIEQTPEHWQATIVVDV